jgi:hypothetical protein
MRIERLPGEFLGASAAIRSEQKGSNHGDSQEQQWNFKAKA